MVIKTCLFGSVQSCCISWPLHFLCNPGAGFSSMVMICGERWCIFRGDVVLQTIWKQGFMT